ncbi:hypothetical protein TNCV_3875231 [Trichonephila clavipes]|uniref:Uncharacterized protein n=1 Tax=Trichonephila clavipes TaxID=2585209 RepID=A0A8X6SW01_TRICX|nr:hypothetical protein TNCV_3875231 [Trichonephila clavipes]
MHRKTGAWSDETRFQLVRANISKNLVRLSELTRQVTPRTNCGHAPPSTNSKKSRQSVQPITRPGRPHTFVLGQRKHSWQMLSQWCVFRRSKNFTSSVGIRMPPSAPINHYLGLRAPTE